MPTVRPPSALSRRLLTVSTLGALWLALTLMMSTASTIACDGAEDDGSTEASGPTPCTTKADCAINCDCDPDEGIDCTYEFACEDGHCYEGGDNGFSKASCEDFCGSSFCP